MLGRRGEVATGGPRRARGDVSRRGESYLCEVEVAGGLGPVARAEVRRVLGAGATLSPAEPAGRGYEVIRFGYGGDLRLLLSLRTVHAAYLVNRFAVPRPRGLLADAHMRALTEQIAMVRALLPVEAYRTLHVSAAGADSPVLLRLKEELAQRAGLAVAGGDGDLLVRLRRPPGGGDGWEALVRLTPRPLSARVWRVCNPPGALNAAVAHAMVLLSDPRANDVFLNVGCGSGTLLIERLTCRGARRVIGCDTSHAVLDCARANIAAAGLDGWDVASLVELEAWDATSLPLPDGSVDVVCSAPPFGHAMGSHDANVALYPALLREAARVARPRAVFVITTHEVRLMETLLARAGAWSLENEVRVRMGGLHPRIFVLRRG